MDINLNGKVALITGTGPNIGSGLALMLAKYGARVACNDIRPEAAEAAVKRVQRNGGEAMAIPGDVADEEQVRSYVQKVLDEWGKIDILVNCAGVDGGANILEFEGERWTRQITVNLSGNFFNTKWVARSMVERGLKGSIVCIVSTAGWQGRPNSVGYCSSKGGIIQFARAVAMDLAPYGIRVNTFTPTSTEADNPQLVEARRVAREAGNNAQFFSALPGMSSRENAGGQANESFRTGGESPFEKMVPMGELPTPTDYGHMIAFICSDYCRLVTGTDFRVDGGALAKYWPYIPPEEKAGPLPLISMEIQGA